MPLASESVSDHATGSEVARRSSITPSANTRGSRILIERRVIPTNILANALRNSARAALLGYSIRSGLLFLLRFLKVARGRMSLVTALRESFTGMDSGRMAAFFAVFAFVWKGSLNTLAKYQSASYQHSRMNAFISGGLAGAIACLFEKRQWRIDMSQQLFVRGMQAVFNSLANNGRFHFRHGNSLIFALATAQVMYGYVMRPETIPPSYYKFILTTGPIPKPILELTRQQLANTVPLDPNALVAAVKTCKPTAHALECAKTIPAFPDYMPCAFLHPSVDACGAQASATFVKVMKSILPVYAALNFVPMVVLKTRELARKPQQLLLRGLKNTARSSLFLGVYVATFMRIACFFRTPFFRRYFPRDSRYLYWVNGFVSSAAIFIEDEKRRSELAMYVLPKGMDALYRTLYSKSWIIGVPHFEVAMFGAAMGLIVMHFETEPDALGGIIYRLLRRVDLTIEDAECISRKEGAVEDVAERGAKLSS